MLRINGRSFRLFNVIDDYNREGLAIEVDFSLPSLRVARALNRIIEWRAKPEVIRCDNGLEYISQTLLTWAKTQGIRLEFIQPGKPQQNAYIERYNRTVRYDWLAHHLFDSIEEVQALATQWLWTYNHERPQHGLGRHNSQTKTGHGGLTLYFKSLLKKGGLPLASGPRGRQCSVRKKLRKWQTP